MSINSDQARQALHDIEQTTTQMRERLLLQPAGPFFILWGIIVGIAYLLTWLCLLRERPEAIGWIWYGLIGCGWIFQWLLGRSFPIRGINDWRFPALWGLLFVYGAIWLMLFWPWNGAQMNLFLITLSMFAYTIFGLWVWRFMLWIGLGVTALTVAGYLLIGIANPQLWLFMALITAGPLVATGIALMRRGKPAHG